jgi:hypothetical protein
MGWSGLPRRAEGPVSSLPSPMIAPLAAVPAGGFALRPRSPPRWSSAMSLRPHLSEQPADPRSGRVHSSRRCGGLVRRGTLCRQPRRPPFWQLGSLCATVADPADTPATAPLGTTGRTPTIVGSSAAAAAHSRTAGGGGTTKPAILGPSRPRPAGAGFLSGPYESPNFQRSVEIMSSIIIIIVAEGEIVQRFQPGLCPARLSRNDNTHARFISRPEGGPRRTTATCQCRARLR